MKDFIILKRSLIEKISLIYGFFLGWFATYFFTYTVSYQYIGCICLFGIHFHHMYIGIILSLIFLIVIKRYKGDTYHFLFYFLLGFSLGIFFDDFSDHFIFQRDPFEWVCGTYCLPLPQQ